jgi:predicted ATPase
LSAGRLDSLAVSDLASELDDYFRLHMPGRNTAPARHRTLQAALDYSYEALTPQEQRLFRRLSVFGGVLTPGAARAAVADNELRAAQIAPLMASLAAKSLLTGLSDSPPGRYRFLETMRAYAKQRLDEAGETGKFMTLHVNAASNHIRSAVSLECRAS